MCDLILPPSPQWYCSKIIDFNTKGVVVFGARHDVFVLDASIIPPIYKAQCCLHKERISSLALNESDICCSASEDGKVKVWSIDNPMEAIADHNTHRGKISCITWSSENSDVVVSGDDGGQIIGWQYHENRTVCYSPESAPIVYLACSNLIETQVAVGYKTGVILIIEMKDWREGRVLQRLRGHDEDVLCVAWCPVPGENFKTYQDLDNPNSQSPNAEADAVTPMDFGSEGHLLASSSKDKTVRIWSSLRGRQVTVFKSPKSNQFAREDKTKSWSTLLWNPNNANHVYVSSSGGEILRWNLDSDPSQKPASVSSAKVLSHNRPVFCMCAGGLNNSLMCTVSMDRQMIFWNLPQSVPVCAVPTLGGFVYAVKTSPIDPGRLAIGVGDSMIRLWNMNNSVNPFDVTVLWQGIKSKVTTLAWHPVKEGRLGFGTDDGRVGVFDTLSNKPPSISSHYHRRTVYVVAWGPACSTVSEEENETLFVIYSVGDGIILSHDPKKFQNEAQDINSVIFKMNGPKQRVPIRSEVSWNPDFSLVAIGNDDGSVEIYKSGSFKLLCVVHIHRKLVNSIQWHPIHNVETSSSQKYYIATGSNEATIQIVDLSSVLGGKLHEAVDEVVLISEAKSTLFGHNNRIVGLQWSPHDDNTLASVSFDGTARVWDVSKGQTIASYHGHRGRLLCVQWSGSDPDVVFTGGEDFTFHKWRVSRNPYSAEDDAQRKKKTKSRGRKKTPKDADDKNTSREVKGSRAGQPEDDKGSTQHNEVKVTESSVTLDTRTQASLDELLLRKKAELEGTEYMPSKDIEALQVPREITTEKQQQNAAIVQPSKNLMDTDSSTKSNENKDHLTKDAKKRRLSKPKSLFPLCGRHENRGRELVLEDIVVLAQIIYERAQVEKLTVNTVEFDAEEHISLGFYLPGRRAILQCLTLEGLSHKDNDNMDYYYQLEIWKGNINGVLRQAREREELSDWLVAMAPMAAFDTWTTVCEDYATQLEQEGQYHKAATYLLAAHKVYSAIDLFKRHRLFKEAIALAKVRLSPIDPVLEDLYTLWAHQLTKDGNFEQAAKCHLAMQQVQNAAVLLARRYNCTTSLQTAARVSMIGNEKQSGMAYAHKLLQQFLLKWEWSQAYAYLKEQKAFQAMIAVSGMHELVVKEIQNHNPEILAVEGDKFSKWQSNSKLFLPDFILDNKDRDTLSPWKPWLIDGLTFPHHALRIFYSNLGIVMDTESLEEMYKSLSILQAGKQSQEEIHQLLIQISVDLVLCMLSFLMSETPTAISHLIHAISSLQEAGHYVVMETIIRLFLPLGPKYMLKLQQEITAVRVVISMERKSNYDGAAKVHTIKRYLTEIKDEDSVSCGGLRCRELDCLRAYYYLAILNSLNHQPTDETMEKSSSREQTLGKAVNPSVPEGTSVDSTETVKLEASGKESESECTLQKSDNDSKETASQNKEEASTTTVSEQKTSPIENEEYSAAGSESNVVVDSDIKTEPTAASAPNDQNEASETSTNNDKEEKKIKKTDLPSGPAVESPRSVTASDFQRQCSDSERTDLSQLTLSQLCHLSRGLLWDVQGKRYALMETLGYIHKAISQLLLAQKPNSLSSSQTDIHSETKAERDYGHGHVSLLEEERDGLPGIFPRQPHFHSAVMKKRHNSEPLYDLPGVSEDILSHFHHHNHHQPHFSRSFSSDSQALESNTREHLCPTHSAQDMNSENSFDICVSCEMLNKSRRVLWEDEPHLGTEHSGKANLTNLINPAKYINVPDEWYNMSADQKYSMPYVTMAILKDEQEYMMHELRRGPDNLQVPFPNPLDSVKLLLNICHSQLKQEDANWFAERVVAWSLKFSVSAQQKETVMELLHRTLTH